eukprot:CAMPEP_0201965484 /NCGR_PEP_ID=MMETSP0904-20121228/10778_1 /ASSEMBLY_ACC=CAM_ASM_000553 /TAXON_ID=420261 /ORGANISM="Thalassiosira antarctica, Strain CCMP982" /LENGTH=34 /DNA_ID= /DNA_START= /DNA_END= /DNA_ORIENTATION=
MGDETADSKTNNESPAIQQEEKLATATADPPKST